MSKDEGPKRKKIVHICARCGVEMEYKGKRMLYLYGIAKYRGWFRPVATLKMNLCPECAEDAEAVLRMEGFRS